MQSLRHIALTLSLLGLFGCPVTSSAVSVGPTAPGAQAAVTTSAGDNNGFQTNPTNVSAMDGAYAVDLNTGTGNVTDGCGTFNQSEDDAHTFYNFGLSTLPSDARITGFEVYYAANFDLDTGVNQMCMELSWDGGTTWTSTGNGTGDIPAGLDTVSAVGAPDDTWGRTWSISELSDANFRLRVMVDVSANNARDLNLDYLALQTYYTLPLDVSGVLYEEDGVTPVTSGGKSIRLWVGTTSPGVIATTTLSGSGVFRFLDIHGIDDTQLYAVWVDNDSTFRAMRYAVASSGLYSIEQANLSKSHVVIHADTEGGNVSDPFSSLSSTDDADIPIASGVITEMRKGMKMLVTPGTQMNVSTPLILHGNGESGIDGDFQLSEGIPYTHTWTTSYDTPDSYVRSLLYIPGFTLVYAGVGDSTGVLYRCSVLSSGCNGASDWTTAFDTTESSIHAMVFDSASSTIYVGTGNTAGIIYRCSTATECDAAGDFTTAYDTPEGRVTSFAIDKDGGVLYAGTGTGGILYRCVLATGCDTSSEFSVAYDTTETTIASLWVDASRAVLYMGTGNDGIIYRCLLSTGCDASGDFSVAYNTPELVVYQMLTDEVTQALYVATGNTNGIIYRCLLSTGCDASGDFTTSYDSTQGYFESLIKDTHRNILYAGSGGGGQIHQCDLSTGCDASGDWSVYEDTAVQEINEMVYVSDYHDIIAGTGSIDGIIYYAERKGADTVLSLNAEVSLAGNFTASSSNVIYFNENKGLVFTATTTGKYIRGELTENSSLGSTTFRGNGGSWSIQNNASTSEIHILSGSLLVPSSVLSISGNLYNEGVYSAEGGGTIMSGMGSRYVGEASSVHFGSLHLSSELLGQFQGIYNGNEILYTTYALDTTNNILYAGSGTSTQFLIYRCDMSKGCSTGEHWQSVTFSSSGYVQALFFDASQGAMYAGGTSVLYRCLVSSLCDNPADWVNVWSHAQAYLKNILLDEANQVIYLSTSLNGFVYRCALSTSCDASGDFTVSLASEEDDYVDELAIDQVTGTLFAVTTGTTGALRRCALSTGCDASTDWSTSTVSAQITDVDVNQELGLVFVANGNMMRCTLRNNCDNADDFLTLGPIAVATTQHLGYSSSTQTLYVVLSNDQVFGCHIETYCDEASDYVLMHYSDLDIQEVLPVGDDVYLAMANGDAQMLALTRMFRMSGDNRISTSTDTTETTMYALTIDTREEVLYAGSGTNGIIYRCDLTTLCDASGDWTTSYDTPSATIYVLVYDEGNQVLYAGTGNGGIIYRCATSTGCNEGTDWTTSYDTPEVTVYDLELDAVGGVLYAGTGNLGVLYRCETSTGCDASGDWTVAYDTTALYLTSLVIDTSNQVLYVGSGTGGIIFRCVMNTLCNESTDFTTAYDTTESYIFSMVYDQASRALYMGSNPSGIIYKCYTESGCDAAGDYISAYDTSEVSIYSLLVDQMNGYLYAGGVSSSVVFRCPLGTNCDTSSDYTTVLDFPETGVIALVQESTTGAMYIGSGSAGTVYRYGPQIFASTTQLTIDASTTLKAPTHLSISGNYTNSGTFDHQLGTTYLNGSTQQIATGTMTGTSAWNNLTITNNSGTSAVSNPSVIFGAVSSTTGMFTATTASTSLRFPAGATTSMTNITLTGTSAAAPIFLRSSVPGTAFGLEVSGTRSINYGDITDAHACAGYAYIIATSSRDGGNNSCFTFLTDGAILTLLHYRFRDDDGTEVTATYPFGEDTAASSYWYAGDRMRLRMLVSNTGASATTSIAYRLEYSSSTCTVWQQVPATVGSQDFVADLSQYILGGTASQNVPGVSDPAGAFVAGQLLAGNTETSGHALSTGQFSEFEFVIRSTATIVPGVTYCFRLTNAGSIFGFVYSARPDVVISGKSRPQTGGTGIESVPSQSGVHGGASHGGESTEGSGSGAQSSGGGAGGGGGVE